MYYFVKTPWWIKKLYPYLQWDVSTEEKFLYLTFDDGPHETATPFVLDQLKQYNAKATFFCVGKNVIDQPNIYRRILDEGHKIGNHTHNHLNGRKVKDKIYIENIFEAAKYIDSNLFRPPYGRITKFQADILKNMKYEVQSTDGIKTSNSELQTSNFHIIMWNVLSGDFDTKLSPEKCFQNVLLHARPGSIIVFHDSSKAFDRMSYALPKMLEHFSKLGFQFKALNM